MKECNKTDKIIVRMTTEQKETIRTASEKSGLSMSAYILSTILRMAEQESSEKRNADA